MLLAIGVACMSNLPLATWVALKYKGGIVMSFLFNKERNNDGTRRTEYGDIVNVSRMITREATFRILNTAIIYNAEEDYYYTLATCVNENNVIETISIEEFDIHDNVTELKGAYIDYAEYEEDEEINSTGTIYYL